MHDQIQTEAENIFDTWEIYKKIVSANNMFHRELYADVAAVLQTVKMNFSFLDLGCGDAAHFATVLAGLPIGGYCGVDLSKTALALAADNLQALACPVEWRCGDLLEVLVASTQRYDVIFTGFALHHLSTAQKEAFFQATFAHLNAGGCLVLVDTVRAEEEDRAAYLAAYCGWLRDCWQGVCPQEKEVACQHIIDYDFPETLSALQAMAEQAGFRAGLPISRYRWHQLLRFEM
ncbi:class I SAM-dependent methyltransferase [Methylovulum psychrotolerans]|uniref:class I SAM-dependent methyltransferase n=1 Tax=Methylovulum psychrotolerans TaxID=1704499 RepID=UPI001BFEF2D2|nr:class I SAM-dependent methyltransferase [Methylovulum psychrotolerans]MBT9097735.1 class I SAM-dependent methyltransferase [Methylovulum psychrotolerans]